MKKFIPIFLYLIFACLSIIVKNQMFNPNPNFLSNSDLNECFQLILWLPIGLLGGSALLLVPNDFLNWLSEIKNAIINGNTPIRRNSFSLLVVRFYGVCFVAFTLYSMFLSTARNACEIAFGFVP